MNIRWLIYFDASALVKRYSPEPGATLVNEIFQLLPKSQMRCAALGTLEVISILVRKKNGGRLSHPQFEQALTEFNDEIVGPTGMPIAPADDPILLSAGDLILKHNINASDAAILKSALHLNNEIVLSGNRLMLWTSDLRLARAAASESLTVFNPETETSANLTTLLTTS